MSADLQSGLSPKPLARSRAQLRPARFDDYEQVGRIERLLDSQMPPLEEWRSIWTGNPLWAQLGKNWSMGWVLESASGEVVGSIGNIPSLYQFRGERLIAATARGWVVAPEYRGRYALWLLREHLNQRSVDLFVGTTVGPMALGCSDRIASRVPAGDWETVAYCVTAHQAFARRALQKRHVPGAVLLAPFAGEALRLKHFAAGKELPKAHSSFVIEAADRFDSRFDVFWEELVKANPDTLIATRDRATLSWHFSIPMCRGDLWILTASRNDRLRAYCIFKRQDAKSQARRMRLVDYQTIERDVDLLPDLLRLALRRCVAENVCVLDRPGVGLAKMRAFDEFAPYRGKQTWPLLYRAVDPALAAELAQPKVWDPSEYDGDASIV